MSGRKALLAVFSNPRDADSVDEFNAWYDGTHVPEFLRLPFVSSARRFRVAPEQMMPVAEVTGGRRFLVLYEIEADDLAAVCDEIMRTRRDRTQSDVIGEPCAVLFEHIADGREKRP